MPTDLPQELVALFEKVGLGSAPPEDTLQELLSALRQRSDPLARRTRMHMEFGSDSELLAAVGSMLGHAGLPESVKLPLGVVRRALTNLSRRLRREECFNDREAQLLRDARRACRQIETVVQLASARGQSELARALGRCPTCGGPLIKPHHNQIYCTQSCAATAKKRRAVSRRRDRAR